ncbi:hypothetical protein AVEN_236914-1 [Araneus ventricosus]|uniref:Uncharacterized protein n=1 Tax=Araneus ventricosus TaxID=182803 RepID=A0A4Y2DQJ0_ARAVE|nr:hypothetical protein AVEN_236914-1 [Araneus ventricosus]
MQERVALVITVNLPQVRFKFDASNLLRQGNIKLKSNLLQTYVLSGSPFVLNCTPQFRNVSQYRTALMVSPLGRNLTSRMPCLSQNSVWRTVSASTPSTVVLILE